MDMGHGGIYRLWKTILTSQKRGGGDRVGSGWVALFCFFLSRSSKFFSFPFRCQYNTPGSHVLSCLVLIIYSSLGQPFGEQTEHFKKIGTSTTRLLDR